MAANDSLNQHQWPHYEQGGDDEHEVPIAHYGIKPVYHSDSKGLRKENRFHPADYSAHLPISELRGGQSLVDANHVSRLSTVPVEHFSQDKDDIPVATGLPTGGYMLENGHHRAAAAVRRGDTHLKVRVNGHYGERFDGLR